MTKRALLIAGIWLMSIVSYGAGVFALCELVKHFPALGPFVFVSTHGDQSFSLKGAIIQPGAFLAVILFSLAVEAFCLGFEDSAIKRLLDGKSDSSKVDVFYVTLKLLGGINVLAFTFSFGTLFWVVNRIHAFIEIDVLKYIDSNIIQFGIVYLINTFVAYWHHRIMHTKWMWELHKVHHAAEEMNVVTPLRNHPIDHIIGSLMNAVPVALLGAKPGVVMFYYAINMVYQSLVHSEIVLKGRWWDKIWITPAAHRVHHSNRVEHFDRNFGIVTFWDKLFGTYMTPTDEKLEYGVPGGELFNRPQKVREIFANVGRWLSTGSEPPASLPMPQKNAEPERLRESA
ncbi:MAG: sterol desaturase family protein [Tepidisphaeraceae bacterium]